MSPAENLTQLNQWLAENIASLTAALNTAHTPRQAQQVEQRAAQFLQVLEAKDRAAAAALEAIRQEIAAGRPYRQHKTTWARRLAELDRETAAHNQVRAALRDQMIATRHMLAQLQQRQRPGQQRPRSGDPGFATSVSAPAPRPGIVRPSIIKGFVGFSLVLLLSLSLIGILSPASQRSPATQATPTTEPAAPTAAPRAPTEGPATEAADQFQTRTTSTLPAVLPSATPAAPAAPTPTLQPTLPPTPPPTATPAPQANANANLRAGPGTNYPLAGALTAGQAVKVIARNPAGDWYQLAGGAWIYSALLSGAPAVPVAAIIPTPPPPTATATRIPPTATPVIVIQPPAPPVRSCCKICTTGKACGDTCIARNKTCHVGPGCACDG